MAITVVGLGPGPADLLSVRAERALRRAGTLVLRTEKHAMAATLREWGVAFSTFDQLYERYETFDQVYEAMAEALLEMDASGETSGSPATGGGGGVTFAVPGHPLIGERSVTLLLARARERGVQVEVIPSLSSAEAAWAELGVDPLEVGATFVDAHDLASAPSSPQTLPPPAGRAWERRRGYLVLQVDSPVLASQVKAVLGQLRGDDQPVALIRRAGGGAAAHIEWLPLHELDRGRRFDHETAVYVPPADPGAVPGPGEGIEVLARVMARLRAPDGCPWDRRQSPMSLRKYVIEEAYEVCDAIERDDMPGLEEELGDLLLQVLFQAQIADEQGLFDLAGVIERLRAKLVRRHPHVFGDATARTAAEVLQRWEAIKREERQEKGEPAAPSSRMDDVARALPALAYADAVQRKAAEVGFEWPDVSGAGRKAVEEALELRRAWADQDPDATHRELGDLLFAIVNVARYMHVDAELALRDAVHRFARRFRMVEEKAKEQGRILDEMSLEEMDALWDEAKRELQDAPERRRGGPAVRTDSGKLEKGGS